MTIFAQNVIKVCILISFFTILEHFFEFRFFYPSAGESQIFEFDVFGEFDGSAKENWLFFIVKL